MYVTFRKQEHNFWQMYGILETIFRLGFNIV